MIPEKEKVIVSFSGGKDSMLALHRIVESSQFEIEGLLTTVNKGYGRTSIHGVREEILDAQAEALGFLVHKVYIPKRCTNEEYEQIMEEEMKRVKEAGVKYVVFGDIFLEDIRAYRENNLKSTGVHPLFPLWGEDPKHVMNEFLSLGYETLITTINEKKLPRSFLGKTINERLLQQFPKNVDICGENGEYHTFVVNGPLFAERLKIKPGHHQVEDDYYVYQDVVFE
ncbi:MAG: diphthine--ammonia ligase [Bacillaceae bacterium]|nr:diphthine--ammonia ligase [Bacillaceae bacterium]